MKTKPLNKVERFVCEMIWGGVPTDVEWVRETKMFQQGMKTYETGVWDKYK